MSSDNAPYVRRRKGIRYQAFSSFNPSRRALVLHEMFLPANDFKAMCSPGVYVFWQGRKALYVGFSRRVLNRMSNPKHGAVGLAMRQCTEIEMVICVSEAAARDLEAALIRELSPQFNVRGKVIGEQHDLCAESSRGGGIAGQRIPDMH